MALSRVVSETINVENPGQRSFKVIERPLTDWAWFPIGVLK